MRSALKIIFGLTLLSVVDGLCAREESFPLYEDRRITIEVPEGYSYARSFGEAGLITVKLADPKQEISLEISFLPDPAGHFHAARARRVFMAEKFQTYIGGSVEKEMRFAELKPRDGSGTYCVFTDVSLVGKTELPPREYLNATTGIKSWPGCAAFFTLLSNGTDSKTYAESLKIFVDGIHDGKPQATF